MISGMKSNSSKSTSSLIASDKAILCSKDKSFANHPGNLMFRERIESLTSRYLRCRSKTEKMQMTKDIVSEFNACGARFLKIDGEGEWTEISNQAARDKVSHALRFAASREKKTKPTAAKKSQRSSDRKSPRSRPTVTPTPKQSSSSDEVKKVECQQPQSSASSRCVENVFVQQQSILQSMCHTKSGAAAPSLLASNSAAMQPSLFDELQNCWDAIAPASTQSCMMGDDIEPLPMDAPTAVSDDNDTESSEEFALFDDLDLEMISTDLPSPADQRQLYPV